MSKQNPELRVSTRAERRKARAIGVSALLIMLMLTVAITFTALSLSQPSGGGDGPPGGGGEVGGGAIVFRVPLVTENFNVLKEYSGTQLQFNATMNRWQSHRALNLGASEGTKVVAPYSGVVRNITTTIHGTTVTIDHAGGLTTVLQSLDRNVVVSPNERVEKGQEIGTVGTTSTFEFTNTPHVRIEVLKDGSRVNPANFIDLGDK